ncbi:MAG: hypothetical protein JST12_04650 [Armatimonadetes bacterium]|nr:hypothetical protein [Armatimonadota bacterium]
MHRLRAFQVSWGIWFLLAPAILIVSSLGIPLLIHLVTQPLHPVPELSKSAFYDHPMFEYCISAVMVPFVALLACAITAPQQKFLAAVLCLFGFVCCLSLGSLLDDEPGPASAERLIRILDIAGAFTALVIAGVMDFLNWKARNTGVPYSTKLDMEADNQSNIADLPLQ